MKGLGFESYGCLNCSELGVCCIIALGINGCVEEIANEW